MPTSRSGRRKALSSPSPCGAEPEGSVAAAAPAETPGCDAGTDRAGCPLTPKRELGLPAEEGAAAVGGEAAEAEAGLAALAGPPAAGEEEAGAELSPKGADPLSAEEEQGQPRHPARDGEMAVGIQRR
eukprot:gene7273-6686_t